MASVKRISVLLVGYGYWGPNLLRNLVGHGGFSLLGVVDPSAEARARVASLSGTILTYDNLGQAMRKARPELCVIATPPGSHFDVATRCLREGCHILVEKPLARSVSECDRLIELAVTKKLQIMVDHTFVYHPAVQRLGSELFSGSLGKPLYYDSVRINLGGIQATANVTWDLAPHDLSILDYLLGGRQPNTVAAVGANHMPGIGENLCYVHLTYDDGFVAHLHLNWMAPAKVRTVIFTGSQRMAIFDDNLPSERLKIFDKQVKLSNVAPQGLRVSYRVGDMWAPALPNQEALAFMIQELHTSLEEKRKALTDATAGRRVVEILEACDASVKQGGVSIDLEAFARINSKRARAA